MKRRKKQTVDSGNENVSEQASEWRAHTNTRTQTHTSACEIAMRTCVHLVACDRVREVAIKVVAVPAAAAVKEAGAIHAAATEAPQAILLPV